MPDPLTGRDRPAAAPPTRPGRLSGFPFHWLLFAAYPVLFLYAQNIGELEPSELLIPLGLVLGAATIAFVVLSRFLDARRAAIVVSGLAILLVMYGPLDDNVAKVIHSWIIRAAVFGAVALLVIVVALRLRGGLGTATLALDALGLVLVAFAAIPIGQQVLHDLTTPDATPPGSEITANGPGTDRDIWWIILDRYGSDRALEAGYGITDNDLGPWLASRGFDRLTDAHANYVRTSLSIASTLHMTHLDGLAQQVGTASGSYGPIFGWLKDHPVGRFLKEQGYRFTQVGSWFPPTRESDIADVMLRPGDSRDFGTLVKDATILSLLRRWLPEDKVRRNIVLSAEYQWQHLGELCRQVGHNFVFAHVLLPHPPYVFLADGSVATEQQPSSYGQQLAYTNDRVQELVECLQDRPEPDRPIIVLQADEGPYPPRYGHDQDGFDWSTATPSELAMKFEILDAMDLPGLPDGVERPAAGMTSVNTFRYLLSSYFGADLPLLPDRVYTSPRQLPYDLTEITDRLPGPDASLEPIPQVGDADPGPDELSGT